MKSSAFSKNAPLLSTRLSFFAAGFMIGSWAPLIPHVKANLNANEAQFGLLLLCLGLGAITVMPFSGVFVARKGARPAVYASGCMAAILLALLTISNNFMMTALVLFLFGGALGALDVAMNVHGAQVEKQEERPLMSGFHAQYSIGGLSGVSLATLLIASGVAPFMTSVVCAAIGFAAILIAAPRALRLQGNEPAHFAFPKGIVLLIATLTGIVFIFDGAMLDWGALLLIERGLATLQNAGIGFVLFSLAMVIARLAGDHLVTRFGEMLSLCASGICAILGIAVILLSHSQALAFLGFVFSGLGAANIAPILFSKAGKQTIMPVGLAVASVTTIGYAGHMIGPAIVGLIAHETSLSGAFWALAILLTTIPAMSWIVAKDWTVSLQSTNAKSPIE